MSNSSTRLFTCSRKRRPIQIEERMVPRNLADHVVGDARPLAKPRQMKLLHFSLPAHVVHQVVAIAFAPNESHNASSFGPGTAKLA